MEQNLEIIYNDLLNMKYELSSYLNSMNPNPAILQDIIAEINDINAALARIETGEYGKCEISGQHIPEHFLQAMPTAASVKDIADMGKFYRKPLYS